MELKQILHLKVGTWLFGFWPCSGQGQFTLGRIKGLISNRGEIRTANFQMQFCSDFQKT